MKRGGLRRSGRSGAGAAGEDEVGGAALRDPLPHPLLPADDTANPASPWYVGDPNKW